MSMTAEDEKTVDLEVEGEPERESGETETTVEPATESQSDESGDGKVEGGEVPPQGTEKIDSAELLRRENKSLLDRLHDREMKLARLEGAVSAAPPVVPVQPTADPFIEELNQIEAKVIEDYGAGSTEHQTFRVTRFNAEQNRAVQIQGIMQVRQQFESVPKQFFVKHAEVGKDEALFQKYAAELNTRFDVLGGYDAFINMVKQGQIPVTPELAHNLNNVFEDVYASLKGKDVKAVKANASKVRVEKQSDTLSGGSASEESPDTGGSSYDDAKREAIEYSRRQFKTLK